ncbi:MAG: hypothetical protein N2689_15860 [Verrucomicrobiae bacterium]|nr:hypothetical protein [Verrucomicrobiae bacterium]
MKARTLMVLPALFTLANTDGSATDLATDASTPPLSAIEATAIVRDQDTRRPWRPYRITLAPAKWIWLPAQRTLPNSFVLFRKEVELPAAPTRADGWIAADSRYKLTVNGQRVQWGPAPCDPRSRRGSG